MIAVFALVLLRHGASPSLDTPLESSLELLGVGLLSVAIINPARGLRSQFEQQFGLDKRRARQSADYMKQRANVRLWLYPAVVAYAGLSASRFEANPWLAMLVCAIIIPLLNMVVDRAMGWAGPVKLS